MAYRALECPREGKPNFLITVCPRLEVKYRIIRVLGNFPQEFSNSLGLGLKGSRPGERCVKVYLVNPFDGAGVFDEIRVACKRVDEPGFASDVPCI